MFSEQNITKAMSQKELMAFVRDMFEHDLLIDLLCVIKNEDIKAKFPEEHKRLESDWEKAQCVEQYIGEVSDHAMQKWFWPVYWDSSKTKQDKLLAYTKFITFRKNRLNRLNKVLEHRYKNIIDYGRTNGLFESRY